MGNRTSAPSADKIAVVAEQQRLLAATKFVAITRANEDLDCRPSNENDFEPIPQFVATTNAQALTATKVDDSQVQLLGQIIQTSKAFQRAFSGGGEDDERMGSELRSAPNNDSQVNTCPKIIQSSAEATTRAYVARWGLVSTVVEAYNHHHELVLRPDDVWQAILTQLSFYVNANATALRSKFVDFQGKKTLVVYMGGSLWSADYASFARQMVDDNIVANIKDPSVAAWLLPDFSTTTVADRVAASVSIMSTLQSYFEYVCCLCCGIPKVTLEGTPADWKALRAKIDRLPEYDLKDQMMTSWHQLLSPVLDEFVRAAGGSPDVAFWDRVCSRHGGGSGPTYLSGWVTVFAVFTHKGVWQGAVPDRIPGRMLRQNDSKAEPPSWPVIDFDQLPAGALSVPVLVDDNGVQYDTQMIAGQFAYEAHGCDGTAVRPRTDWCIAFMGEPKKVLRAYKQGEIRA